MNSPSSDRNLLFGILALQNDFITRDALIDAMNAWVLEKSRILADILVNRGAIAADDRKVLDAMIDRQIAKHGSAEHTLSALDVNSSVRLAMEKLNDPHWKTTLPPNRQPAATVDFQRKASDGAAGKQPEIPNVRYRVLRPHAKGGLGEVFIAEDTELHREVALKEIQPQFAGHNASQTRFLQEAEITGRLEHPGIVPVYGLGTYIDGRPFYAMRFIEGDNLKRAVERFHRTEIAISESAVSAPTKGVDFHSLEFRQLLGRFVDVCNAIAYAHSRGILHRDIKPGNIMLGKFGETLVVDWGLAKVVGRPETTSAETTLRPTSGSSYHETQAGAAIGTPAFMSPEQAAGKINELGMATDVYSLGATLYAILTGKVAFQDCNHAVLMTRIQMGEFPHPRQIQPLVPKSLEAICVKAMSVQPADRYSTALALAHDIEHWLGDEPVAAFPESAPAKMMRWTRKNPGPTSAIAATVCAGVLGLIVGSLLLANFNRELSESRNIALKNEGEAREQRDVANREKKRAEEERKVAEAVSDFLGNDLLAYASVFRQNDPNFKPERDLTVRVALQRAARGIEGRFANQPLIEAAIRRAIGSTLSNLGEHAAAIEHSKRAVELCRKAVGDDDPATLLSLNNLGSAYWLSGDSRTAEPIIRKLVADHVRLRGEEDPETLENKLMLCTFLREGGRFDEAQKQLEPILDAVAKDTTHPARLLFAQSELARIHLEHHDFHKAEAAFRKVLDGRRVLLGRDHPGTITAMGGLAITYMMMGNYDRAEPVLEEAVEANRALFGPDHHNTIESLQTLGDHYLTVDKPEKAEPIYRQMLEYKRKKFGNDDVNAYLAMRDLGLILTKQKKYDESEKMLRTALAAFEQKLPPTDPIIALTKRYMAYLLLATHKYVEAENLFRSLLAIAPDKTPNDKLQRAPMLSGVASCLYSQSKFVEAEGFYRQAQQIYKSYVPDVWFVSQLEMQIASSLAGQKRFAEAEPMMLAGFEGISAKKQFVGRSIKDEAIERVAKMYDKWDKKDKAAEWRQKAKLTESKK